MEAGAIGRGRVGVTPLRKLTLLFLLFFLPACSKMTWLGRYYMVRAENAFEKAHALRTQKGAEEVRMKQYRIACQSFAKAYETNPELFTLNRIYSAMDACLRTKDSENEKKFREFEEAYAREHPKEVEYGEAGFMIGLE